MPRQNARALAAGLVLVALGLLLIAYAAAFSNFCFCLASGRCGCYGGPLDYVVFYLWVYWGISLWSIGVITTLVGLSLCAVGQIEGVSLGIAGGSLSFIGVLLLVPVILYGVVGFVGFLTNGPVCALQTGQCNAWTSLLLTMLGAAAAAMGFEGGVTLMKRSNPRLAVLGLGLEALAGASALLAGAFLSSDHEGAIYLGAPILELGFFGLLFLKLDKSPPMLKQTTISTSS